MASGSATAVATYNPFVLGQALDDCSKRWWGGSLLLKFFSFLIGGLLFPFPSISPYLAALLALLAELSLYRSDNVKGRAQELRRKLDFQDAFSWKISGIDLSDIWVRSPKSVKDFVKAANKPVDPYFASKTPPGNIRGLENISESAWWTKHLAESLGWICLAILIFAGIGTIIFLIVAIQTIGEQQARVSVARTATAFIMLFISLGLVKLTLGYFGLSRKASASEQAAIRMLSDPSEQGVIKIFSEYHVARACGPIIPTFFWEYRRKELNETWEHYRAEWNRDSVSRTAEPAS